MLSAERDFGVYSLLIIVNQSPPGLVNLHTSNIDLGKYLLLQRGGKWKWIQ